MSPTRRQFLVTAFGTLGAAAATAPLTRLALANTVAQGDRYFVFCYFPGAWDILVSLDPKVELMDAPVEETRIEHGWDDVEADDVAGAAISTLNLGADRVTNCLEPFALQPTSGGQTLLERSTIVRGLSMDTLTHEVGRRRFLTGKSPTGLKARGNSIATLMASMLSTTEPIPNLSAAVESYNTTEPSWASALDVSSVDDLLRALRPADLDVAPEERLRVESLLDTFRECMLVQRSPARDAALASRKGASQLVGGGYDAAFDLRANRPEMAVLRDRFGIGSATNTVQARMAMAAQALTQGVSRVVSVTASRSCDTHFDNWATDQFNIQHEGYSAVAALAGHLDDASHPLGGTYLDRTTIVCFSDFCRTPLRNGNGGRDHWLTNAALLVGPDLNPGVFGASSPQGMAPMAVDLNTGVLTPGGDIPKPEHLMAALFRSLDPMYDDPATMPNDLRVGPYRALLRTS